MAARSTWTALSWLVLAVPAGLMVQGLATGGVIAMDLLHPSGELALRLMILAMLAGPLADFFGRNRFFRAWLAARRTLGVAAFGYGVLHLACYLIDMVSLVAVIDELPLPAIWTGWLSFALMLAAASISSNRAMRRLGRHWKSVQRGVYAALIIGLVHWGLLDRAWGPALVHLTPILMAWALRGWTRWRGVDRQRSVA
jgi:sulfoxide reductase heme-binding subunit YedZ